MRENFKKALLNIIKFGDTDIFPFPFERHMFDEKLQDVLNILEEYNNDLEKFLSQTPPLKTKRSCGRNCPT